MFRNTVLFELSSCVFFMLITVQIISATDDTDYANKAKRSYGVNGLIPFPRVGRNDPEQQNNWEINTGSYNPYNSFEEYEEYPHVTEVKRGLFPFPRVGRSGNNNNNQVPRFMSKQSAMAAGMKRGVPGAGNGMWFGPRLGRVQKRAATSFAAAALQESRSDIFTPRLGRSSSSSNQHHFHSTAVNNNNDHYPDEQPLPSTTNYDYENMANSSLDSDEKLILVRLFI